MVDDQKVVVDFKLTRPVAQKRIREIAVNSKNIIWGSQHATERMEQRGLFNQDVLRILRNGFIDEDPEKTSYGEWKCKMTLKIRGGRVAGVVVIILLDGRLFPKTVEWEDGR
jgi:hypothetical protein